MNPIEDPYLNFIPAVIFGVVTYRKRQPVVGLTALLWFLYGVYEVSIKLRITCSGECNIRVDLLFIYPVLIAFTIISIIKAFDGWG
jgi:hypothetical protein